MGRPGAKRIRSAIDQVFGPGGSLEAALDHYEERPQQLEMAHGVGRSFMERRPLIVEAATGTGKTLAYLVPAILSGKKVVVSTGTKALQEQLFFKDIPLLERCLDKSFDAVLLKGRRNYLCLHRFQEMQRKKSFRSASDVRHWPTIQRWVTSTESGDRADIPGLPDDYATWSELSVGSESCLGSKCKYWEDCYVQQARKKARDADVIVVNHHLFFADLMLKDGGFGEILPEYDALVFDEAHHIEKVATDYFGLQVSNYRFRDLSGDVDRALESEEVPAGSEQRIEVASADLMARAASYFDAFRDGMRPGRYGLDEVLGGLDEQALGTRRVDLEKGLDQLAKALRAGSLGEAGVRLAERCAELKNDLQAVTDGSDSRFAYVAERREGGVFLQAAPIDLAKEMRTRLLRTHDAMVFTSATLATGGDFSFFKNRLGMGEQKDGGADQGIEVDELLLAPVFNYEEQSLLYVPSKLPAPHDPDFCKNVALIIDYLLKVTEGRAFLLFTSYRNMNDVYDRVAPELDYPAFIQGERSKRELLDAFRQTDHSVLFATASFWEGVDVEGEALSLVVIDKLPFANPSDPLTRARLDRADESGGNSFYDISLPTAAIALRQGFGRLIRSANDRGVVAILDSRIAHKRYGNYFLKSLPPAPVVWRASQVKRWWQEKIGDRQESAEL